MDKPQVDAVEGIPPAIAIDQTNPVRTSRSTVGTMTELNDHLKLLYARAAGLYCRGCGQQVRRDTPESIYAGIAQRAAAEDDPRLVIAFPVPIPKNFKVDEIEAALKAQGYDRFHSKTKTALEVIQDRVRWSGAEKTRVIEALESALRVGQGKVNVYVETTPAADAATPPLQGGEKQDFPSSTRRGAPEGGGVVWKFSSDLHCADCDIHYSEPTPSLFSFNSPIGACETCRGFGRVIGIDYGLVVPDEAKTLREGAVRWWQSPGVKEGQDDLRK